MAWLQWTWIFLRNRCGKRSLSSWNHHLCNPALLFWIYQINRLHDFFCIPKSYTEKGRDARRWARACVVMTGVMFGTSMIWGKVAFATSISINWLSWYSMEDIWYSDSLSLLWGCRIDQEGPRGDKCYRARWKIMTKRHNTEQCCAKVVTS